METPNPFNVRTAAELLAATVTPRPFILDPILSPGSAALIWGPSGVGKSFLALGLALAVAGGGSFLGWTAPRPRNVLYLDGEMSAAAVGARLRLFGSPPPSLHLWLAADQGGRPLDLTTLDGLERLVRGWRKVPDLIVIDSLSSLVGVRGGDSERWSEMRYFLGLQKRAARAVVMVHHANRDGAMRGLSQRADAMDLIMALRRPRDWQPTDGARVELRLEKPRHQIGAAAAPIEAQLCPGADGTAQWQWHRGGSRDLQRALPLFEKGMSAEAVAKAIGVSARTGYRLQQRAREGGCHGVSGIDLSPENASRFG
jgi:hypothetical protein